MEPVIITEQVALTRIVISLVLGALIGLEREINRHPAGIRTFILVCVGSTLAMLVSIYICQSNPNLLNGDPGRIAAQVLTGIGFIGAGLIIKNTDGISGLTTAACIFVTAIIGLAVGVGMIYVAVVVTAIAFIILIASPFLKIKRKVKEPKE